MKKIESILNVCVIYMITAVMLASCEKIEETAFDGVPNTKEYEQQIAELGKAVYHEGTQTWLMPQNDPYTLENFRKAYDNLVNGKSSLARETNAVSVQIRSGVKLQATHHALKIWPKTEEEQRRYESDKDLDVRYTPMNYMALPDQKANLLRNSAGSKNTLPDERRYSEAYTGMISTEGITQDDMPATEIVEDMTVTLPVLYVVWPVEKAVPAEMEYEVLYDVFLPKSTFPSVKSSSLTDEAMQIIENEAIRLAAGIEDADKMQQVTATRAAAGETITVMQYDNFMGRNVPIANLSLQFRSGSSTIATIHTDKNGSCRIPDTSVMSDLVTLHFVFRDPNGQFNLVVRDSSVPIVKNMGTLRDISAYYGSLNIVVGGSSAEPHYAIYRAVNYYYNVAHPIPLATYSGGTNVISWPVQHPDGPNTLGSFHYNKSGKIYIRIFPKVWTNNSWLFGTVCHELGHFSHYRMRGNYGGFSVTRISLQEGWAEYVGWELCERYYESLGRSRVRQTNPYWGTANNTTGSYIPDITYCADQNWTYGTHYPYSPMFVDLRDSFNQGAFDSRYVNDDISNVPYEVLNRLARESRYFNNPTQGFRQKLDDYIGVYFTQAQFDNYIYAWDNY